MRRIMLAALLLGLTVIAFGQEKTDQPKKGDEKEMAKNPQVLMQTNYGDIVLEIYATDMPIHGGNFLKLVKEGYYDSLTFHRVVHNFVIQGGDPTGTGMGGPPGNLEDEASPYKHDRGTIAMARGGEGASKSQFYINLKDNYRLDEMGFAVFGKVVEGMDVVDKIGQVETGGPRNETPVKPVIMTKVSLKE